MSIQFEADESVQSGASARRRWLVVALLFLLTLGGTVAARLASHTTCRIALRQELDGVVEPQQLY